ncbi:metal ABC transporter permease [Corynebacterium uropygiale]|uniref:Metal ABC transporter permease n=1 Tax=Corynebacterium uropygiale TaxID=1775911 RepID=A0A9X1U020_9CORY|nr:metal ABC transporter permease [Corynebacterium uropygiale]MCF4005988.1 metal ABC transporter permease [Corynebacterium uropygiale]
MLHTLSLPLAEIILVGALSGLIGVLAILDRRVFFTESMTHGTFPGAVLGVVVGSTYLGLDHQGLSLLLMVGAFVACLPLSWLMHQLAKVPGVSPQSAAGIILTLGFALGYFLSRWFKPLPLRIENFLAGSLLNSNATDVAAAAVVFLLALAAVALRGRHLIFHCFDPVGYRAAGHSPGWAEAIILALVCCGSVAVIPAVGTILSIAMLVAPAAGVLPWCRSTRTLFIAAPLAGVLIGVGGLAVAVWGNLSAGGTIAIAAGLFYVLSLGLAALRRVRA